MTDLNVTSEMVTALAALRDRVAYHSTDPVIISAMNTLDNLGVFAAIDEATGYDTEPQPMRVSKCTCPSEMSQRDEHYVSCPGDPAEWGDLAYTQG